MKRLSKNILYVGIGGSISGWLWWIFIGTLPVGSTIVVLMCLAGILVNNFVTPKKKSKRTMRGTGKRKKK